MFARIRKVLEYIGDLIERSDTHNRLTLLLLVLQRLIFFDGAWTILSHVVHMLHGFPFC